MQNRKEQKAKSGTNISTNKGNKWKWTLANEQWMMNRKNKLYTDNWATAWTNGVNKKKYVINKIMWTKVDGVRRAN